MCNDIMEIDAEKLKRMRHLHVAFWLIDVRSAEDFAKGHIQGAFNLTISEFLSQLPQKVPNKETPIVVYDQDGIASGDLVVDAEKLGYLNIVNLKGGYSGFINS